jgi:hypothetical protein
VLAGDCSGGPVICGPLGGGVGSRDPISPVCTFRPWFTLQDAVIDRNLWVTVQVPPVIADRWRRHRLSGIPFSPSVPFAPGPHSGTP